ncbi:hypothetical protein [Kiloniella laminariae]|uniref:hypothetical protein n=1 Tax=Kiloniella laminariae TaxID=454162 RepID=UPI0012F7FA8C|nr:hypothetical protein [Kiloniella laminariae]
MLITQGKAHSKKEVFRALYIIFAQDLADKNFLAVGQTPESFAETRLYCHLNAKGYLQSFDLLQSSIITVSSEQIQDRETRFWHEVLEGGEGQCLSLRLDSEMLDDECSCHLPTSLEKKNYLFHILPKKSGFAAKVQRDLFFQPTAKLWTDYGPQHDTFFRSFGYTVLGPVFYSYGHWVIEQNVQTPFFGIMREGQFLSEVVARLGGEIGGLLYINRSLSLKASLGDANEEDALINFLVRSRIEPLSLKAALDQLNVSVRQEQLPFSPETLLSIEILPKILSWLNEKNIKDQIVYSAFQLQERLLRHIENVLSGHEGDLYLLDMGYAGNILSNLQKIFIYRNMNLMCRGRFLLSSVGAVWAQQRCEVLGFLAQNGAPAKFSHLYFRTPEILELCASANLGTTIDYTVSGEPICDLSPLPFQQYDEILEIQKGIFNYIDDFKGGGALKTDLDELKLQSQNILSRLIRQPNLQEAEKLGRWSYDENMGDKKGRKLIEFNKENLDYVKTSRGELFWPQARQVLDNVVE